MPPAERAPGTLTVQQIAQRFGVSVETVVRWIRDGELRAVNVSRSRTSKKLRWRITAEALAAFEAARTSTPAPAPRVKRKKAPGQVIEFYT